MVFQKFDAGVDEVGFSPMHHDFDRVEVSQAAKTAQKIAGRVDRGVEAAAHRAGKLGKRPSRSGFVVDGHTLSEFDARSQRSAVM